MSALSTATRRRRTRSTPATMILLHRLSTSTGHQRGHVYISQLTWEKNRRWIRDDWLCVGTITNHIQSTRRRASLHWWRLFRLPASPPPPSTAGFSRSVNNTIQRRRSFIKRVWVSSLQPCGKPLARVILTIKLSTHSNCDKIPCTQTTQNWYNWNRKSIGVYSRKWLESWKKLLIKIQIKRHKCLHPFSSLLIAEKL